MLFPHGIDVLFCSPADHLFAHWALNHSSVVTASFWTLMGAVAAVFEAKDIATAVTRERQKVLLVASEYGAVRADVQSSVLEDTMAWVY